LLGGGYRERERLELKLLEELRKKLLEDLEGREGGVWGTHEETR
jgi:hypothetical protein